MPRHSRLVARCVALTVACSFAPAIQAQQIPQKTLWNSDQVPRDLVLAMFQTMYGNSSLPDLIIGDAPASLKSKVPILPGARVLGALLGASSSQIFLEIPGRADTLTAAIWRELPKLGWTRYQPPSSGEYGGFRPAPSATSTPLIWCNASGSVSYSMVPRGDSTALVRYSIQNSDPRICSRLLTTTTYTSGGHTVTVSSDEYRSSAYNPSWPTLYAPAGSDFIASSCRTSDRNRSAESTTATIRTTISVQDLVDHYARQMTDLGWTATATEDSGAVSKTFEKKETDGRIRRTTLRIFSPRSGQSDCRDQTMSTEISR